LPSYTPHHFEQLMRLSLEGDKLAYAQLLRDTSHLIRPYLTKKMHQIDDVDDLIQDILLSVHKVRHTYDSNRPYIPWVMSITKYRFADYLRRFYADQLHQATDISQVENILVDEPTTKTDSYECLEAEITTLPKKQATILTMMHQYGFTSKQVAEKIGMTESAVKVAAFRAYKILKKKWVS